MLTYFSSLPGSVLLATAIMLQATACGPKARNTEKPGASPNASADTMAGTVRGRPDTSLPAHVATSKELTIFVTMPGEKGSYGKTFGCNDNLVPLPAGIIADPENRLRAALDALLHFKPPDTLYNVFLRMNLQVAGISEGDGILQIDLAGTFSPGGMCDGPRIKEQLKATVAGLSLPEKDIRFFINGRPLDEMTGGQ